MLPVKRDLISEGLKKLPSQFDNSPVLRGWVKSHLTALQDVHDILFQLLDERGIHTAIGEQLDVLGRIVGEKRYGRSDLSYRLAILNKALINRSSGTPEELISFLKSLTSSEVVKLWEHPSTSAIFYASQNVNAFIAHSIQDAAPLAINTAILFDLDQDSLVPVDLEIEGYILSDHNGNEISVVTSGAEVYSLGVSRGRFESTEHSWLPELYEVVLGTQQITDPTFAASGWTLGANWAQSSNTATHTPGSQESLTQAVSTTPGVKYRVSYTVSGRTVGSVKARLTGGTEVAGQIFNGNGTVTETLTAVAGNVTFGFEPSSDFDGGISNVSVFTLNEEVLNPLCDLVDKNTEILEITKIITDTGDNLADEFGNQFIAV